MSETITIGSRQVPRTVAGAISRLELITAKHAPESRADVDFLRARFNEVEAQRDELIEALRDMNIRIGLTEKASAVLAKVGG